MTPPTLRDIARLFLHLGLTAFGGLAMVEPMRRRVVADNSWLSLKEFLDGLALCQMLPGATVVQLAAYVGCRLRGAAGAFIAAAAFILPGFFLMWGLSALYFHYGDLTWVKSASRGLHAVVIALLLQALWRLGRDIARHWPDLLIALLALLALWARVNYFLVFFAAAGLRLGLEPFLRKGETLAGTAIQESHAPSAVKAKQLLAPLAALLALALTTWGLGRLDAVWGQIARIFLKIGAVSFGGGYVMIPILQWEVVDHLGWLTLQQFLDGILLSYVTPGPLLILAAFVGYWVKGLPGGALATVAVFLPPILFIVFLFPWYQQVKDLSRARPLLQGILAALVGMLALVTLEMGYAALTDWKDLALLGAAALALMRFRVSLIWVAAAAAGLSWVIY
jgi:chromate transporter